MAIHQMQRKENDEKPNPPPLSKLNIQSYSPKTTILLKCFFHIFTEKEVYSETNMCVYNIP